MTKQKPNIDNSTAILVSYFIREQMIGIAIGLAYAVAILCLACYFKQMINMALVGLLFQVISLVLTHYFSFKAYGYCESTGNFKLFVMDRNVFDGLIHMSAIIWFVGLCITKLTIIKILMI